MSQTGGAQPGQAMQQEQQPGQPMQQEQQPGQPMQQQQYGQPMQQQYGQAPPPYINQEFGQKPQRATCPHCNESVLTNVENEKGLFLWVSVGICCFIGCCCIPCLSKCFKDQIHRCPRCNAVIGARKVFDS